MHAHWRPDLLLIERGVESSAVAQRACAALPGVPIEVIEDARTEHLRARDRAASDAFGAAKRRLLLYRERGQFLTACQAGIPGVLCCSYLTLGLVSNCPYDCSYCFLQEYLGNNATLKAVTNVDDAIAEIATVCERHVGRHFRIGTGELADSLALDPLLGHAAALVGFAVAHPNVVLELKTKSDCIEEIIGLDPCERVVVSWSLTPPRIVEEEEPGTTSFQGRLAAAARCQAAGYRVGFHFDPLVDYEGCEEDYREAIAALAAAVDMRRVAWMSLGSLRTTSRLRGIIRKRHPHSRVLLAEQIRVHDGKWRVFQPRRVAVYRRLTAWLRTAAPGVPLYLCMESPEVWERVFGEAPPDARQLGSLLCSS